MVSRIKEDFPLLAKGGMHYLDSAATSQVPVAVLDTLYEFETEYRANVHGGVHCLSRAAIDAYRRAREDVARFINAPSADEVVFTYGATSSINLLAFSFGDSMTPGDEIAVSVLEHHSNLIPWQALAQRKGLRLRFLPMTEDGRLDLGELDAVITERCRLVAITHCSNVTGAITDIGPVVAAAKSVGAKIMVDGAQQVPHGSIDVQRLDVDFYVFSGHKMFGPTGIGVLWGRRELLDAMPPFMTGGQMARRVFRDRTEFSDPPQKFEAGTPPIAAAIGLGAAVRWMEKQDWSAARSDEVRMTGRILDGLSDIRGARVLGPSDLEQRRGVVSFVLDGVDVSTICNTLDDRGVAVRCGDHCAQILLAGFGVETAARASIAIYNDDADIAALIDGLDRAVRADR